jgi:hypothetical protein
MGWNVMRIWSYAILLSLTGALLAGCAANSGRPEANAAAPIALSMSIQSTDKVVVTYILAKPTAALHYAQYLGGYRSEDWQPGTDGFRWVKEGDGERIERTDGKPFGSVSLTIPMRYRSLPKSYAPFSPFSEGSVLMHSGQFHACADLPCDGTAAMPIKIAKTAFETDIRQLGSSADPS